MTRLDRGLWLRCSLLGCALSAACASEAERPRAPRWLDDTTQPLPAMLSELGLYPEVGDPSVVDPRAVAYAPAYALWSNGSDKARYLVLPEGEAVAVDDAGFDLPVGSALFKTFAFEDDEGARRYVETRVLVRGEDAWGYGAYQFRDDQREADLLEGKTATEVEVKAHDGSMLTHAIPSTRQCRTCHESSERPVLGFTREQLGLAHDDAGGSALAALHDQGVLDAEVEAPEPLAADAATADVLGYVLGNCVHCHNGWGEGANSSFDLRPEVMLEHTVGVETEDSASGIGLRIAPGDPEASVLYLAFVGRDNGTGVEPMPPLGVRLRAFIEGLGQAPEMAR
jgi:hypothetical protein